MVWLVTFLYEESKSCPEVLEDWTKTVLELIPKMKKFGRGRSPEWPKLVQRVPPRGANKQVAKKNVLPEKQSSKGLQQQTGRLTADSAQW